MDGKHVNVASIKQKITGHKILCLIMAIMLCMLMVPRGLAFATEKAAVAKNEAQNAQKADVNKEEVKTSEVNPAITSGESNFTTIHGTVNPIKPSTKTIDGGWVLGIGLYINEQGSPDVALARTEFKDQSYTLDFTDWSGNPINVFAAWALCWTEGFALGSGITFKEDGIINFELDGNVKKVNFNATEHGHYHISPHTVITLAEGFQITLGDIIEEGIDLDDIVPDIDVPVYSEVGMMDDDHDFFFNVEGYHHIEFTIDTKTGYKLDGWTHDGVPFKHGETIKVDKDVNISPIVVPDTEPKDKITISGEVDDEKGSPVEGALVAIAGYDFDEITYNMTDKNGHYEFKVPAGFYAIAALDLEAGIDYDYGYFYESTDEEDFVLSWEELPFKDAHWVDFAHNDSIDHYNLYFYAGEDEDNMEEILDEPLEVEDIPVYVLFDGSNVYAAGAFALGFTTSIDFEEFDIPWLPELNLGLIVEPVVKDNLDEMPYCWAIDYEDEGEEVYEQIPPIYSHEVSDDDADEIGVDLYTREVGYLGVSGGEGHNHFNFTYTLNGEKLYDDETEAIPDIPQYLGNELYVDEDGTLYADFVDEFQTTMDWHRVLTVEPEPKAGYEFDHWVGYSENYPEGIVFDESYHAVFEEAGEQLDFQAVYVPEGSKGGDKESAHGVAQTGDALPFALVGGIALIALASLGVALYSRKRFDA